METSCTSLSQNPNQELLKQQQPAMNLVIQRRAPRLHEVATPGWGTLLGRGGEHPQLADLLQWYVATFRDPMMLQPPEWFKAFIYCEAFFQMPFFPIAAYAFLKGGCKWIRTPAIIYSTHVATTLFAILAHILFHDFSRSEHVGPRTHRERLILLSVYVPYLLIPLLILFTMLCNPHYNAVEKRKRK
ncbi:PREDICTED: transmembrane protein 97 [Leptosomus discolor]|nr:PREDICTED: transmembrane protein 97 [Leptosomus discolor]